MRLLPRSLGSSNIEGLCCLHGNSLKYLHLPLSDQHSYHGEKQQNLDPHFCDDTGASMYFGSVKGHAACFAYLSVPVWVHLSAGLGGPDPLQNLTNTARNIQRTCRLDMKIHQRGFRNDKMEELWTEDSLGNKVQDFLLQEEFLWHSLESKKHIVAGKKHDLQSFPTNSELNCVTARLDITLINFVSNSLLDWMY